MPASPMERRMARLEGAYEQVSLRLTNIDPRFDGLDRKIDLRFDALDKKLEALDAKWDQRFNAVEQRFMWMVGLFATSWASIIAAIYLHH